MSGNCLILADPRRWSWLRHDRIDRAEKKKKHCYTLKELPEPNEKHCIFHLRSKRVEDEWKNEWMNEDIEIPTEQHPSKFITAALTELMSKRHCRP